MGHGDEPACRVDDLVLDLQEDPCSIAGMRRRVAEAMGDLSEDELYDVMLVATELLTNAYDHGAVPRRIRFVRSERPGCVRVEVDDTSSDPPILGRSTISEHRGRGLVMVDSIAQAWGTKSRKVGKTVWATIPCEKV
ncbi:ATP-binding protein [Saccharothrix australiensis]|uniref:Histidine kinase-like protein n=1 Tax=Saccharothrix australiensis TaxID=2072 RepID=A0A495W1M7_9PSEU|nr:ATP-binding protein [Saccharothrix australiensis]RKT54615.1 histidine kinase-like protein [Saccharothrix australiensis]